MINPTCRLNVGLLLPLFMATVCCQRLRADQLIIDRPDKVLQAHGVALTYDGVFAAVRSDDPEIRKAASDLLAERWPKLATPVIGRAMSKESDGFTRIRMATDLVRLGDTAGRQALVKECHNRKEWGSFRMEAASVLSDEFRDYSCLDTIFEILRFPSDPKDTDAKESAVTLAPGLMVRLQPDQSRKLFELVLNALGDPWPGVRSTASMMLFQIGDPAAIPRMEAAIASEKDEDGRRMMTMNLENLQRKTQMQPQQKP